MSAWKQGVAVAAVGVIAFVAGRTLPSGGEALAAQPDKKPTTPAQPAQPAGQPGMPDMAAMEKLMQPGEHHKKLDAMLGDWEGTFTWWPAPGAPAMECPGKVHREWTLDGRFVVEHVEGEFGGQAFKGVGYIGYNTFDKRYEMVWLENMATWISTGHGTADASGKTFTFTGEMINPMTGKREKTRSVLDVSSANEHVMTGWATGPDGKEYKNCEGRMTRR